MPKKQKTTVNVTIKSIEGNEAVAEINGEKIVNTNLVNPALVVAKQS